MKGFAFKPFAEDIDIDTVSATRRGSIEMALFKHSGIAIGKSALGRAVDDAFENWLGSSGEIVTVTVSED